MVRSPENESEQLPVIDMRQFEDEVQFYEKFVATGSLVVVRSVLHTAPKDEFVHSLTHGVSCGCCLLDLRNDDEDRRLTVPKRQSVVVHSQYTSSNQNDPELLRQQLLEAEKPASLLRWVASIGVHQQCYNDASQPFGELQGGRMQHPRFANSKNRKSTQAANDADFWLSAAAIAHFPG